MNEIKDKITKYYNEIIEDVTERESAIKIVTEYLLNKNTIDTFSGVTATRGFYYQYLLFIYYCLECVENDQYQQVWYEIGDDITLVGENCIEFIQVKTEKENCLDNRINPNDMYKRSKGLDSWIDKLFLQYEDFIRYTKKDIPEMAITFKIASNTKLSPTLYKNNSKSKFQNTLNTEKLITPIAREFRSKVRDGEGKEISVSQKLEDKLSNKLEWYFEKSVFESFGSRYELEVAISEKINKIFKEDSRDLALYCIKRFLAEILYNTSNDADTSKEERGKFCYEKVNISIVFKKLIDTFHKECYESYKSKMVEEVFNNIYIELKKYIDSNFNDTIGRVMNEKLGWISEELKKIQQEKDIYVYERFLNRLINLQSGSTLLLDPNEDKHYIKRSLLVITYLLTTYNNHNIEMENTIRMLIHSCSDNENEDVVIIANGREVKYESQLKKDIDLTSRGCHFFTTCNSDIDCILVDAKKDKKNKQRFGNVRIKEYEKSEDEILATDLKINFVSSKVIEDTFDEIADILNQNDDIYNNLVKNRRSFIYEKE